MTFAAPNYRLAELVRYFLYLGSAGFGGPVALVEYMHRDLVERRGWITEEEYREGLALANLSPGPLAAQLAIYLGFVHYRFPGASLVAVAFVLPSFAIVIAVGWAYLRFGGLPWMQAVFYGVGAAIIGIISWSAYRLTRKTIGRDPLLWVIYVGMAAITAITETERSNCFHWQGWRCGRHEALAFTVSPDQLQLGSCHSPLQWKPLALTRLKAWGRSSGSSSRRAPSSSAAA